MLMLAVVAALAGLALAVCLLDLVLTLGVIRRLREHTEVIARLPAAPDVMLAEGRTAGAFETVATTGEPVSRVGLAGQTLVAALAPDCPACAERLPAFLDYAGRFPGGRDRVLVAVVGSPEETADYRVRLEPVARVVVEMERQEGGLTAALDIGGYPAFGILDASGTVVARGLGLDGPIPTGADRPPVPAGA
jgi:hypothetical protein